MLIDRPRITRLKKKFSTEWPEHQLAHAARHDADVGGLHRHRDGEREIQEVPVVRFLLVVGKLQRQRLWRRSGSTGARSGSRTARPPAARSRTASARSARSGRRVRRPWRRPVRSVRRRSRDRLNTAPTSSTTSTTPAFSSCLSAIVRTLLVVGARDDPHHADQVGPDRGVPGDQRARHQRQAVGQEERDDGAEQDRADQVGAAGDDAVHQEILHAVRSVVLK